MIANIFSIVSMVNRYISENHGVALLVTVILFALLAGIPNVSAQAAEDGTISAPDNVSVEAGDKEEINITYEQRTEPPQGIAYTLTYDPNVISVVSQEQGGYLQGIINISTSSAGEVIYVEDQGENISISPDKPVTVITVEPACGITGGATTDLEFTSVGAAETGEDFFVSSDDGTVEVVGSTSSCGDNADNNNDDDGNGDSSESASSGGGSGGGGGGGVGGAGGGGGGGGGPTGPPTPAQVENTLNLVEPEDSTTLEGTTSEESEGESAESDEASGDSSGTSVQDVIFENTESRPVEVADYGDPPETVEEEVINSIAADNEEIAAATGDATSGSGSGSNDNTGEDGGDSNTANGGDSGSEPAEVDVVQFAEINPTEEMPDEAQAEVEFSVDRDKVTNPNSLTIYKDAYVFEAQEEQWVEAETTVTEVTDDSIEVTASVDEFSLFAVMEIDDSSAEPTATPDANETSEGTQTEDGIPGFGIGITLIAVVILSMVIRVNRLGK